MAQNTEFLNLDEVAAPKRHVTIKGVKYHVEEMTVDNFIETTRSSKSIADADQVTQMEATVGMVKRYIPEAPLEVLRGLNFQKLDVLMNFINGNLQKEAAVSNEPAEGAAEKK